SLVIGSNLSRELLFSSDILSNERSQVVIKIILCVSNILFHFFTHATKICQKRIYANV
ncbi:hypothetical protein L9F63_010494, partial [Diploptera punctata]